VKKAMKSVKREIIIVLTVLSCISLSILSTICASTTLTPSQAPIDDITLEDDAFHGRGELPYVEWWYFDAKLNNGYSLTLGIHVIDIFTKGIVTTRLNLYYEGTALVKNYEKYFLRDFSASSETPSVYISGNQIIKGTYDTMNKSFLYTVTMTVPGSSINLQFLGTTQGWKQQQQTGDWWVVVLPQAEVTGTITIEDTTINVNGTGYHDHNWGISPWIAWRFGWFWGTCHSSSYTITWADILSTRRTQRPMMVINTKEDGYLEIPADTIWFTTEKYSLDHFKRIPLLFTLETITDHVFLVVHMEVLSVDHTVMLGFINYWRYHVRCTGNIIVDGHIEMINDSSIMEYLRFR
jgi:predicted secreted hydrolase